jgi:aminopeptidase
MDDATLERLADLVVGFGANVQRDQIVSVSCEPGKEPLTRAIAASAYRRGARFVDVAWFDPWV